ncbi:MAG: AAA family ATPase [Mycetocola sp.]
MGRQDEIDAFDLRVAIDRGGRHSRAIVLHGLGGVGKTVLLNQFRDQADRAE